MAMLASGCWRFPRLIYNLFGSTYLASGHLFRSTCAADAEGHHVFTPFPVISSIFPSALHGQGPRGGLWRGPVGAISSGVAPRLAFARSCGGARDLKPKSIPPLVVRI